MSTTSDLAADNLVRSIVERGGNAVLVDHPVELAGLATEPGTTAVVKDWETLPEPLRADLGRARRLGLGSLSFVGV